MTDHVSTGSAMRRAPDASTAARVRWPVAPSRAAGSITTTRSAFGCSAAAAESMVVKADSLARPNPMVGSFGT